MIDIEKRRKAAKRKDRMVKWMFTVGTFILAFIPTWFWMLIYFAVGPHGFWQKFAVLGLGTVILGGVQFVLVLIFIGVLFAIWD